MTLAVTDDATYQARARRIWAAGRYGPVAVLVAVAVTAGVLPAAAVVALVGLAPPLVWLACDRAASAAALGAGVDTDDPLARRWSRRIAAYWWSCYIAAGTAWAGGVMLLALAGSILIGVLLVRGRVLRGASRIDVASLPPLAQRIVASSPRPLRLYSFTRGYPAPAFASGRDLIHIDTSLVEGDPEQLTAVIAHEVAHHQLGLMRFRLVGTGVYVGGWAIGWLVAVASGRLDASLIAPSTPFVPAFATLLAGFVAGGAVLEPLALWRNRINERATDRAALELLGTGAGYVSYLERMLERRRASPNPPRVFHALSSGHPTPAELIATARAYQPQPPPGPQPVMPEDGP